MIKYAEGLKQTSLTCRYYILKSDFEPFNSPNYVSEEKNAELGEDKKPRALSAGNIRRQFPPLDNDPDNPSCVSLLALLLSELPLTHRASEYIRQPLLTLIAKCQQAEGSGRIMD